MKNYKAFIYIKLMTICSLSLLVLFVSGIVMYLFREPSEEELKKFNSKTQDRSNWSNMGF